MSKTYSDKLRQLLDIFDRKKPQRKKIDLDNGSNINGNSNGKPKKDLLETVCTESPTSFPSQDFDVCAAQIMLDLPAEARTIINTFYDMINFQNEQIQSLESNNRILIQKNQLLERLATTDALTGCYNRRGYDMFLKKYCAQVNRDPTQHSLVIMSLDINNLKKINDGYSHHLGDKAIRLVGQYLRKNLRQTDVVARIGGDEFDCLLPNTSVKIADKVASRTFNDLKRLLVNEMPAGLSQYMGVATAVGEYEQGQSIQDCKEKIDQQLQREKGKTKRYRAF